MSVYVGLGANVPSSVGAPETTIQMAILGMLDYKIMPTRVSPFYISAPVPKSDQPWYVNAVAEVVTGLSPVHLMQALLDIEKTFGRVRSVKNAPRLLDLDLLDYDGRTLLDGIVTTPHPHLHERAFVLHPLRDIAPEWKHPETGINIHALIASLPPQEIQKLVQE
jgi:2-amino-4-hydroxy-6-hydroxymethyldihydropteridine diphosphokinase